MIGCPNCHRRNPKHEAACVRCNAPLTPGERKRREQRRQLNELREANGKSPLPIEETDDTVEPVDRTGDGVLFIGVCVLFGLVLFSLSLSLAFL